MQPFSHKKNPSDLRLLFEKPASFAGCKQPTETKNAHSALYQLLVVPKLFFISTEKGTILKSQGVYLIMYCVKKNNNLYSISCVHFFITV